MPFIPVTTWVAGGVAAAALVLCGVQTVRLSNEQAAHAATLTRHAEERAAAYQLTQQAEAEQRAEEQRRLKEKDHAIQQAIAARDAAAGDARRAQLAAVGLRSAADDAAARARKACSPPQPGNGSAAADDPAGMLANVFRLADERAGVLAQYADAARIAGTACERSYDSLAPVGVTPAVTAPRQ